MVVRCWPTKRARVSGVGPARAGVGNREHDRTGLPEPGNEPRPYLSLGDATSIELELHPVVKSCGLTKVSSEGDGEISAFF